MGDITRWEGEGLGSERAAGGRLWAHCCGVTQPETGKNASHSFGR